MIGDQRKLDMRRQSLRKGGGHAPAPEGTSDIYIAMRDRLTGSDAECFFRLGG
jgi:hypothetical protein